MQKLDIWFLSAYEQPKGHTSRTYDYAQELIKRGHTVTLFTNSFSHRTHEERLSSNEKWRIENVDGIRVVWLRTTPYKGNGWKRGINMFSFAMRSLEAGRTLVDTPQVVVGDSVPPLCAWAALRLAKRNRAAFVYQIRDVWPIALVFDGSLSKNSPVYYAFRLLEKHLYRNCQHVCATMPFLNNHVRESGGDPNRVTWIPNGVNLERYSNLEAYDGGPILPLSVMYVGAFGFAHDPITIVRAAHILQQRGNTGFRFIFVGDGVKRDECRREALANGIQNIEFRESVEKAQVPQIQNEADILIASVTNSLSYQFGMNLNKIYDYFATGRPIIFSGSSPNDPVAASGAGYSIPPENPEAMANALEKLLEMPPAKRIELGKRARSYAEQEFDVTKLADQMEQMMFQAMEDRRNGKPILGDTSYSQVNYPRD